ncbi:CRISPR-associated protein Cas1 [Pararhizobium polonicum]|uniref:CRISPR-associated endonuclease Cas1 n=1 Tax=Pararhizobium polonicum TaxID=1612624 RepID=A0A1C7P4G2_9HYPH|nr:type II CRISPR-associated endonuclease Cas1 [Pararhizobium polonicum]OBZ94574.1 CRISPR-associated protein Cas1 [Pararhizobium polonicum]
MDRIVDISTDGLHLAVYRGFLTVSKNGGDEVGRIALDDIGALIVHAHGTTWSNHVFVKMSERGVPVVLCAANHAPVAVVWPLEGHHAQGARLRAQIDASKPLQKQVWRKIVSAKVRMQGHVLAANGLEAGAFDMLARKVRSGDPDNIEAQAARRYWKALLGPDFYRDREAEGLNVLLNYGYTVLRAIVARAICASGLHPTIGVFHSNRANAFALADDLMEPYRPLVDQLVRNLAAAGKTDLSPETKRALTSITTFDLDTDIGVSPLSVQIGRFVHSVAVGFETGEARLDLPVPPSALHLAALGKQPVEQEEA